jgi:hypothetical protein
MIKTKQLCTLHAEHIYDLQKALMRKSQHFPKQQ